MRDGNKNQNLLNLIYYMNDERRREDRGIIIELGKLKKPYLDWTKQEKEIAERVCGSFNLIGLSTRQRMCPIDITKKAFRDSALKCYDATIELLKEY